MKSIIILLSILFFVSCEIATQYEYSDPIEIMEFVHDSIKPLKDEGGDNWQLPKETQEKSSGDCEDMVIYMLSIMNDNGMNNGKMIIIDMGNSFHACVLYQGIVYDPAYNIVRENYIIVSTYTFDMCLLKCTMK